MQQRNPQNNQIIDQPTDSKCTYNQNECFRHKAPVQIHQIIANGNGYRLVQNIEGVNGPVRIGEFFAGFVEVLCGIGKEHQYPRPNIRDLQQCFRKMNYVAIFKKQPNNQLSRKTDDAQSKCFLFHSGNCLPKHISRGYQNKTIKEEDDAKSKIEPIVHQSVSDIKKGFNKRFYKVEWNHKCIDPPSFLNQTFHPFDKKGLMPSQIDK